MRSPDARVARPGFLLVRNWNIAGCAPEPMPAICRLVGWKDRFWHLNSWQRSTSVAFGAKRTLTEPRLQKALMLDASSPLPPSPPAERATCKPTHPSPSDPLILTPAQRVSSSVAHRMGVFNCLPLPESHTKIISVCLNGASLDSTALIVRGPTHWSQTA
jgi:hypothetical protein